MAAEIIDGRAVAQAVRAEVRDEVAAWTADGGAQPGLATVLVGDDPASAVYVGGKQKASAEVGIAGFDHRLAHDTPHDEVERLLLELNADPRVSGILLQLPTPPQVDGPALTELIRADKDVDGLTPVSAGLLAKGRPGLRPGTPAGCMELLRPPHVALSRAEAGGGLPPVAAGLLGKGRPGLRPCTPAGCMELLRRHDVALSGAEAVVVGRSDLVGKPVAALLTQANATVTVCHSRTRDLAAVCAR